MQPPKASRENATSLFHRTTMDLGPSGHAEALLVKAARTYGVHAAKDDVRRALADPDRGTALVEWANMHLASDHLLTADELAL